VLNHESIEAILHHCGLGSAGLEFAAGPGSSFHSTARLSTRDGRYFLKFNPEAWPGHFAAESAGLRALAEAGSPLVFPEVLGADDGEAGLGSFLLLSYLETGDRGGGWAEALGRGLAELHRPRPEASYGFECDGYCGSTPQPNPPGESWVEFYRVQRLRAMGDRARERNLDSGILRRLDTLIERLEDWIDEGEGPCLIHGDLWSGNALATAEGRAALVDPAAYRADREAELGMMSLFGGFPSRVWEAYQEFRPPRPGWRHRLGLYELYHLLNHYVIFGGSYAAEVDRRLCHYVG
jgi:fructosamine-3-kinase